MLKKVLVVVDEKQSEFFEGKNLTVINKTQYDYAGSYAGPQVLIVKDGEKEFPKITFQIRDGD